MKTIVILALGLFYAGLVQAQVGTSISADGSAPNNNAMLDVKSPTIGAGKGILIPRVTVNQRTNASLSVDGGLLDSSGNLRGGAAQGLIVYQTESPQGLYFNTSPSATPSWAYLGDVGGYLLSNVWALAGSTTNYLPRTGGTMSGALNMGGQIISNTASIDFSGNDVAVGRGANGSSSGAALGWAANGAITGVAVGASANGADNGAAVGRSALGTNYGAAMGWQANGAGNGAAVGRSANGANFGVAVGRQANGINSGAALGYLAVGTNFGAAVGRDANGINNGAAVGYGSLGYNYGAAVGAANGADSGAAMGYSANGINYGVALGRSASGTNYGVAVGYTTLGYNNGVAVGFGADGYNNGAAVGRTARGADYGAAVGAYANGARTNVAIGCWANANSSGQGTNRIAIGNYVTNTNTVDDTAVIRGTLWLDGGTGVMTRATFGSGNWTAKAFEIDHPLDPENKVLRHFCLEGPQVWNVYAGNAQLVNGQAVITLPDYYSALNLVGSEVYSLTPMGRVLVWIDKKIENNQFLIGGDKDVEVSWTIKVVRNDPGCREDLRRRPVEQWKNEIGN